MGYRDQPRGAHFTNSRSKFPVVPIDFTLAYGSRAQRRFLMRALTRKKGDRK